MTTKNILHILVPTTFTVWSFVGPIGENLGISHENLQTTEGMLAGIALGLLAWLGFLVWKGEPEKEEG
ncbi:MAG: hypothetical protein ACJAZ9_000001 [Neolewinella sp.]|jgi:hypothetical protein